MTEVATPRASSRDAGPEGPSIDDLLKSGTFHQRLAAARALRERVLAARGETAEQFIPGPKPWERPEYMRGEPCKITRDSADRKAAAARRPAIVAKPAEAARGAAAPSAMPVEAAAAAVVPAAGRWRLYQVAGGAAFGIAIGIGAGYWFARSSQDAAAVAPAQPVARAPVTGPIAAALVPDEADLSNVTSVAASLSATVGTDPVAAGPMLAPQIAAPDAAEAAPPRLAATAAALPRRGAAPKLDSGVAEMAFARLADPARIILTAPRTALPAAGIAAPSARPDLPEAVTLPAALRRTAGAPPAAMPGDAPLARQDLPPPLIRPAAKPPFDLIVHAPATLPAADFADIAAALSDLGVGELDPKPVGITVRESNVRFFHPEDAAAAGRVAEALGIRSRDFTDYTPRPPRGTVELWLAGKGQATPKVAAKPAKPKKQRAAAAPSQVDILKNRLIQQLRAGVLN